MIETLADVEALTLRCRSQQTKAYIAEAILCYRSGAYRATIVSVWIAVIFDLVDKLRELSLAGDGNAKPLWQQYETYIQQMEDGNTQGVKKALEFERDLIRLCKDKLQFFNPQQMVDLERLREDRHRCAHPSFQRAGEPYMPTAEQARLHLVNAVAHVLSQPPVQGKAQLVRLLTLIGSDYFPLEHQEAVTQLRASALGNANAALVNGFVDMVIFEYFEPTSILNWKRGHAAAALNAVLELYRPQVEERLRMRLNNVLHDAQDSDFPRAVQLFSSIASYWGLLLQPARDKIRQYIRTTPNMLLLPSLGTLCKTPDLEPVIREKVSTMDVEELSAGIQTFGLGPFAKERALQLTSEVGSWNGANRVITSVVLPVMEYFSKSDYETLIQFPTTTRADLVGATAYTTLISELRKKRVFENEELNLLLERNNAGWLVMRDE